MNLNIQLTPEDYVKANYLNMRPRPLIIAFHIDIGSIGGKLWA